MTNYVLEGPKWPSNPITWSFATTNYASDAAWFSSPVTGAYRAVIEQAIQKWASVSGLTFQMIPDSPIQSAAADIRVGFGDLNTATTGVIGQTSYSYAGAYFANDVILQLEDPAQEPIVTDAQGMFRYQDYATTLYQVAAHELGHSLGLGHSSDPTAVMYPVVGSSNPDLSISDIVGIQAIYGTPPVSPPPADFRVVAGYLGVPDIKLTGVHTAYTVYPGEDGAVHIQRADGQSFTTPTAHLLEFTDGTAMFDPTGNAEDVARIYEGALHRAADPVGLEGWTTALDGGTVSLADMARAAVASPEFISGYGTVSDASFVTLLYRNSLAREPDAGGFQTYTSALTAGTDRGSVLLTVAESQEAKVHFAATIGDKDRAAIYRLYETILGRAPDPDGQAAYASRLDQGVSMQDVARDMLSSPEYIGKFGSPDDGTFITHLYENGLRRAPDAGGHEAWTANLEMGATRPQTAAAFSGSTEAKAIYASATHDGLAWLG